jgi:hypothetical protein
MMTDDCARTSPLPCLPMVLCPVVFAVHCIDRLLVWGGYPWDGNRRVLHHDLETNRLKFPLRNTPTTTEYFIAEQLVSFTLTLY